MRVLHLLSNAKWTGPAEPALNLCLALRKQGIEADFACAPNAGRAVNKIVETARDRGIEPILSLHLSKHRSPFWNALDRVGLARLLGGGWYDVVHCHLDNDHRIAGAPAARVGIPLVRSSYEGLGFQNRQDHPRLLARAALLIEPSCMALEHDARVYGYPRDRMRVIPSGVDTERFDTARAVPDARRRLGIPPDAFVVGIVARLQVRRRFEDFFAAFRKLADSQSSVHAIVVGRGTRQEEVAHARVREFGLEGRVHLPGYVDGDDYVGMIKAFDVAVMLVPGTDGACRFIREALAMAKPAVVADRGMLREIVHEGQTGFVCDGSPDGLFASLRRLAADRSLARVLGQAARQKALDAYALEVQARAVAEVYTAAQAAQR